MIKAAFISDLHLHPEQPDIQRRFEAFLDWAKAQRPKELYILGDFFHAWAGDDCRDAWSAAIAKSLADLADSGIQVFFMAGNRDFLLGQTYAKAAKMQLLAEPCSILLGEERVLLVHGDRYCTADRPHQWLRRLTRNGWFSRVFLALPRSWRMRLVLGLRAHSQQRQRSSTQRYVADTKAVLKHLLATANSTVIYGHFHQAEHQAFLQSGLIYQQYVLSDWDDRPQVLCYDSPSGFYFELI